MGSYEEWVVDRGVDAAWLQFRVRLADHLAAMTHGEQLRLGVGGGDEHPLRLNVRVTDEGELRGRFFIDDEDLHDRVLTMKRSRSSVLLIEPEEIDESVKLVHDVFRQLVGAPHPSFVEVLEGDLVLVDPPQHVAARPAEPAGLPQSVMPSSNDELRDLVRRAVVERLGREPLVGQDGSIILSRGEDAVHLRVSRSRRIIEVWSVVARGVDDRKARKLVARMGARFHFFSFALHRDRVFVSTTVNAGPFCPEHLDRAIDSTFAYLEDHAPKLRARLQRRDDERATDVSSTLDTDLVLVFGAAGNRQVMVELARGLAGDSRTTLGQWRRLAKESEAKARLQAANGDHGAVQNALIDQVIAWRSVAEALTDAVAEIATGQSA